MSIDLERQDGTSPYIELFTLNATNIGGGIYRLTPMTKADGNPVKFNNIDYYPLPIQTEGWEFDATGKPNRPTITVSNVNYDLLAGIISLGDLIGATLTRVRTFERFLDHGSTPDPSQTLPADIMIIDQKTLHNKEQITWTLTSFVDQFGIMLPRRQVTRYGDSRYGSFPGVGLTRR